jgi:hypothetical protein
MAQYARPTLDTKFHINFDWWQDQGKSLRVELASHLCASCRKDHPEDEARTMDWVDPQTGEVKQVNLLWHTLRSCCSQQQDFITRQTPLTTAVFLTLIANDNAPMSPIELQQMLAPRSADLILRTIGRRRIYYGIKPVVADIHRSQQRAA